MSESLTSLADFDLEDPENLRRLLSCWDAVETLSNEYPKVLDLKIEFEEIWKNSPITPEESKAIRLYLIEHHTQKRTGEIMGIGTRWVARLVNSGLNHLAGIEDER